VLCQAPSSSEGAWDIWQVKLLCCVKVSISCTLRGCIVFTIIMILRTKSSAFTHAHATYVEPIFRPDSHTMAREYSLGDIDTVLGVLIT